MKALHRTVAPSLFLLVLGITPMAGAGQSESSRLTLAMSAAPTAVSRNATIVEIQPDGDMVPLREGTNGWLCWPDDPGTPEDDPACGDSVWQGFFEAYMTHAEPYIDQLGISYMLQGSKSASNTDPFATEPPMGQSWLDDGPHLMLLVPDAVLLEGLPDEHDGHGGPYVMFKGTPYAHVMVPIPQR